MPEDKSDSMYQKLIVSHLERLEDSIQGLRSDLGAMRDTASQRDAAVWKAIADLRVDVGKLQVRAALMGAGAGGGVGLMVVGLLKSIG